MISSFVTVGSQLEYFRDGNTNNKGGEARDAFVHIKNAKSDAKSKSILC